MANEGGVSPPLSVQEECLGLAVLDLWRMAKERNQSVREVCRTVRYPSSRKHSLYKLLVSQNLHTPYGVGLCIRVNFLHYRAIYRANTGVLIQHNFTLNAIP